MASQPSALVLPLCVAHQDARELSLFPDGSFDVVFDKSTLDALKCAGQDATSQMSSEIHRILSSDGVPSPQPKLCFLIVLSMEEVGGSVRVRHRLRCTSASV